MIKTHYITSAIKQFNQYKSLADKTIEQVPDDKIYWQYNPESNSIAMIVKHMAGNMFSRFTDFFTSDGEKPWRNRDKEFENEQFTKAQLLARWNEGWNCLFKVLNDITEQDLSKTILIRNEEHTVMEAINRQLTHYASHVGQIIYIGKMVCGSQWKSLSIQKGASEKFNATKGL